MCLILIKARKEHEQPGYLLRRVIHKTWADERRKNPTSFAHAGMSAQTSLPHRADPKPKVISERADNAPL